MYRLATITLATTLLALPASPPTYAGSDAAPAARTPTVGPTHVIMPTCADYLDSLRLVTDRHGVTTAVWGCGRHVLTARSTAGGGWTRPLDLTIGRDPVAATDRRGRVTVSYRKPHGMGLVTRRWVDGRWQRPVDLTYPSTADRVFVHVYHQIAINARGDTIVSWMQKDGAAEKDDLTPRLYAAFRPYDGSWGPTVRIDPEGFPEVALLDREGRATVIEDGREFVLHERSLIGHWSSQTIPGITGNLGGVAENAGGDLLVTTWTMRRHRSPSWSTRGRPAKPGFPESRWGPGAGRPRRNRWCSMRRAAARSPSAPRTAGSMSPPSPRTGRGAWGFP